jgi:PAS domain S-box-containing protein
MNTFNNLENIIFDESPVPLWLFKFNSIPSSSVNSDIEIEKHLSDIELLAVNKAVLELYEAANIDTLRKNLLSIIPEKAFFDILKAKKNIENIYEINEFESKNISLKGRGIDVLIRSKPLKKNDDNSLIVLLSTTDITQHNKLLKENRFLARLPEANPDVVGILKCEAEVLYLNNSGKVLIQNRDLFDLLPGNYQHNICASCDRKTVKSQRYSKDDKEYLLKIRPFENEDQCMIIITDLTESIRLQQEVKLYATTLQNIQQPIVITNNEAQIITFNKAFSDMYGFDKDELLGRNPHVLNPGIQSYIDLGYSQDDYNTLFSGLWQNITNPLIGKWEGIVINQRKDTSLLWSKLFITTVFNEKREIINYIGLPIDITKSVIDTEHSKIELYKAIADLAELRDNETGNHMRRVGIFSKMLAKELGQPNKYCDDIEVFSPLHDIGKVGISDSILLAPRTLSNDEFEIMKTHTLIGYRIVKNNQDAKMAAEIILNHHENFDGSGYPHGRKGKEIPLSARITAISDIYDALRSIRPYKKPWTHEEAMREIIRVAGTHLDPSLVEVFKLIQKQFEAVYFRLKDE